MASITTKAATTEVTPISRVDIKRMSIADERETIAALKKKIYTITDLVGMDEEKINRRITAALRSEYGRVNGMVNLLAAIIKWPAEQGEGTLVNENKALIEKSITIDAMLLEDITTFRGYHSFVTDDLSIVTGVQPNYEDYTDYVHILLTDMGLVPGRVVIEPTSWEQQEEKAIKSAHFELERLQLEVELHKTRMQSLA